MAQDSIDAYDALNLTLGHIKAVVHGCYATLEFADDHTSPVPLLFVAKELCTRAEKQAEALLQARAAEVREEE